MTADELRSVREAHPFRPFTVHLADGRQYRIHHRDYLSMSPGGRTVIVYGEKDAFSILDLLLITEVSVEPPAAPTAQPVLEA